YNIEGIVMAPGSSTTAYIAFRAPLVGPARGLALLVPVTNFTSLLSSTGGHVGQAQFGAPIQLNLGGPGFRHIVSHGVDFVLIAGPPGDATGVAPNDFRLFTWTGQAADAPHQLSANLTGLNPEVIVQVPPGPLTSTTQVQLLSDNGTTVWYGDGI